jgi:predicted transcriptional regulator
MKNHYPTDPKFYIQREYESRHARNPSYSWRSFARDLHLSPSMLSEFLKGRYGLSRTKALAVSFILRLDEAHSKHFVDLLEAQFHRSPRVRASARCRLNRRLGVGQRSDLKHWKQFAELEVQTLIAEGEWILGADETAPKVLEATPSEVTRAANPDGELQALQAQVLNLSATALDQLPATQCASLSVFTRLAEHDFPALREELNECLLQILSKYQSAEGPDAVFTFALQAFPVFRAR